VRAGRGRDFVIYTPRRSALSRETAYQAASRECLPTCAVRGAATAKPLIRHDAAKQAYFGRLSGIICPIVGLAAAAREAREAGFLGEFREAAPISIRAARGNINESAELLITAAVFAPASGYRREA
jgi:hypothetical protein